MIKKNILLFIPAKDFNEEEFLTVKNNLLNQDYKLFLASDSNNLCIGNNGLRIKADVNLYNIHPGNFEALVLIGGNGMRSYWKNSLLILILQKFYKLKKVIGAICSAPIALANAGILADHDVTCYPQDKSELERTGIKFVDQPVVVCGNLISAQAPRDSLDFSRALIHKIN